MCFLEIDWIVGNGFQHLGALDGSTAGPTDAPNIPKAFHTVETRQIFESKPSTQWHIPQSFLPHLGGFAKNDHSFAVLNPDQVMKSSISPTD